MILLLVAQEVSLELPFTLEFSEVPVGLFFLNSGFLDPSRSEGIVGSQLNPAVLSFSKEPGDLYVALSGSGESRSDLNLDLELQGEDTTLGVVPVDLQGTFRDAGGFDYLGFGYNFGRFALGFAVERSSGMKLEIPEAAATGVSFSSDSLFSFEYTYYDSTTDTELPFRFVLSGDIRVNLYPSALAELSQQPVFLGGSVRFGPLALGLGYKARRYRARFEATGRLGLQGTFRVTPRLEGWNTDSLYAQLELSDDSLLEASYYGDISATQHAVIVGAALIPVKFLGISLSAEAGQEGRTTALYRAVLRYPDSLGSLDIVDSLTDVEVDTSTHTVSGKLYMHAPEVYKTADTSLTQGSYTLLRYGAVRAGVRLLILNLGGGLEWAEPGDGFSVVTNYFSPSLGIPLPKSELRLGAVLAWRYARLGQMVLPSVPLLYGGLGLTVKPDAGSTVKLKEVGLGVKVTGLSYMFSSLLGGVSGAEVDYQPTPEVSLSAGFRLGLDFTGSEE